MILTEEADRPVLHLTSGDPLGVDVRQLLELECSFEGGGDSCAAADEHEATCAEVFLRNRWKCV